MRVFLFGAGAMSCLFGARLAGVAEVTLLDSWEAAIEAIRRRGIIYEDAEGQREIRVGIERLDALLPPADLAIVFVKSWQTEAVAARIESCLHPHGAAVSLQNGLGNLEILGPRALSGSTAVGATLVGPGHVRLGGNGPMHIAGPAWITDLLRQAGFEAVSCNPADAQSIIWGKLVINCGINALSALLRVPNGELLLRPDAAVLMSQAAMECAAVARAKGIPLPFPDAAVKVREVAKQTAENRSSMLQDILRGAPTECDAINGAVAAEGKRLGVPAPVNEFLWRLMRSAANRNGELCTSLKN